MNGQYWGIYQSQERADQHHGEAYLRGDKDDYDVMKDEDGGIEVSEGNSRAWNLLYDGVNRLARLSDESEREALYLQLQGLYPDGTHNSDAPVVLDVDNLIQYMLIIIWTANADAPIILEPPGGKNWIGMRDREGDQGFAFFIHNAEWTLFPGPGPETRPYDRTGPFPVGDQRKKSNPQWIHQQLMASGKYRRRFSELRTNISPEKERQVIHLCQPVGKPE